MSFQFEGCGLPFAPWQSVLLKQPGVPAFDR
jgi:hypothetical protein